LGQRHQVSGGVPWRPPAARLTISPAYMPQAIRVSLQVGAAPELAVQERGQVRAAGATCGSVGV